MAQKLKQVNNQLLSVVVPVYSCPTIATDLKNVKQSLETLKEPYEIICVVDGSSSPKDKTFQRALKVQSNNIKVYTYSQNKGKGYAIRYGMAKSYGGIVSFIDAGSDLEPRGLAMALAHMRWYDADIVVGSKRHRASLVNYPWQRRILSFIVQLATRFFFGINVSDTQTGLKLFKRGVLKKVLPRLLVKRFAFDLEILAVASRLGFNRIYESPVVLNYNFASTVKLFGKNSVQEFFIDYLAIIYRTHLLRYYDDAQHDLWKKDPDLRII